MKKSFATFTLLALLLGATVANAGIIASSAATILSIQPLEYDDIPPNSTTGTAKAFVNFTASPMSTPCIGAAATWRIGGTTENIRNILSVATAAKLAGRQVKVYWNKSSKYQCDGGTSGGTAGYPVMIGIEML